MLEILPAELVGFKKRVHKCLTSAAVGVADSVLLNKDSCFIFLSFSNPAKTIKSLSVDSSS